MTLELAHERTQKTYVKIALSVLIGIVLFGFACWGGSKYYTSFEANRLARRGAAFLSGGDLRQASLAARRGLQLVPNSLPNLRLLAEIAEKTGDKNALSWRRQALEANPNSPEDAIALAKCAIQFNDLELADKTIKDLGPAAQQTADFYATAAGLAESRKDMAKAEESWAQAVRLAPDEASYQLHFALVLLRTEDSAKRATGLELLQKLRTNEKQGLSATRALIVDGMAHHRDPETLTQLARELQKYPGAKLSDGLVYAGVLRQLHDPEFVKFLAELENRVRGNPSETASLISWMSANDLSLLAMDYAHSLPAETTTKLPVAAALAAACINVADWPQLRTYTINNWDENEFLRHAFLARALRGESDTAGAQKEWTTAEKSAGINLAALNQLVQMAGQWGWHDEKTEILWTLAKHPDAQIEALHQLNDEYTKARDTIGLYKVLKRLNELQPEDRAVLNNLAQVSLLLQADMERSRKIAADLYAQERSNPGYASTYAYALYTKGDTKGALAVMKLLPEEKLRDPSIAVYYGILLAADGNRSAAAMYLRIGASRKLLPEEERLVTSAQNSIQ